LRADVNVFVLNRIRVDLLGFFFFLLLEFRVFLIDLIQQVGLIREWVDTCFIMFQTKERIQRVSTRTHARDGVFFFFPPMGEEEERKKKKKKNECVPKDGSSSSIKKRKGESFEEVLRVTAVRVCEC
jgi:hypothetical protein